MGFFSKIFGLEVEDVPEYSCNGYGFIENKPQDPVKTLKKRVNIEIDQIDQLIDHLKSVRKDLVDLDIPTAAAVPVTAEKVINEAKHAEELVKLKDLVVQCGKEMKYIHSLVKYAGEKGFYGACTYHGNVSLIEVETQYYMDEKGDMRFDYYTYLLHTVYYFHLLLQFKGLGYTIRVNEKKNDFFVMTATNVPDRLAVYPEYLDSYKVSKPIEDYLPAAKANAKVLYDKYPELFTYQMKTEFGV